MRRDVGNRTRFDYFIVTFFISCCLPTYSDASSCDVAPIRTSDYKGRYFDKHTINSTESFFDKAASNVYGCQRLCQLTSGCIALNFRAPSSGIANCLLYNLTNIHKYISYDNHSTVIVILPVECKRFSSVNGGWSGWSNLSTCSTTCGDGVLTQERNCTQPSPYCNGDRCQGKHQREASCRVTNCQVEYHHDSEERTHVIGFERKQSYQRNIAYDMNLAELKACIDNATRCEQFWKYESKGSLLRSDYASWTSSEGETIQYFPSSNATAACYCSGTEDCCCPSNNPCNADANNASSRVVDEGYLTDASLLPVTKLSFGDTGHNGEEGFYTLGPLVCYD